MANDQQDEILIKINQIIKHIEDINALMSIDRKKRYPEILAALLPYIFPEKTWDSPYQPELDMVKKLKHHYIGATTSIAVVFIAIRRVFPDFEYFKPTTRTIVLEASNALPIHHTWIGTTFVDVVEPRKPPFFEFHNEELHKRIELMTEYMHDSSRFKDPTQPRHVTVIAMMFKDGSKTRL